MKTTCKVCSKAFGQQVNLKRHIRLVHNPSTSPIAEKSVYSNKCLENGCNISYKTAKGLIWHLTDKHEMDFKEEELNLSDIDEFYGWKSAMEKSTNTSYIFKTRSKTASREVLYYYCNRTQTGKGRRNGEILYVRNLKSQGSSKMASSCTSQIKVIVENKTKILVQWCKTHYGHNTEIQHLRLSKNDRIQIASKLIDGETSLDILHTTRESIGSKLKRIDILSPKDIYNIKKCFNIESNDSTDKFINDATPFNQWIKKCLTTPEEENPVIFYKQHGEVVEGFSRLDFCLIIMNSFQKLMLQKHGSNLVAIAGMHELNADNLELTTVIVLNDCNRPLPVAFMITNNKTMDVYNLFFKAIKSHVGLIQTKVLICDVLSEEFYNEWAVVMGCTKHQLFSSGHVEQVWLTNLNILVNKKKRGNVYKMLKSLQLNTDKIDFETTLNKTIEHMLVDKDTKDFGNYFKINFACNFKKWAHCFRNDRFDGTNVQFETIHKQLNYIYLHRNIVRCLGANFYLVVKCMRDKSVEKLITSIKGKHTKLENDIFQRHKIAINSFYNIQAIYDNVWMVSTDLKISYIVQKCSNDYCCTDMCVECKICIHTFSCSCSSYVEGNSICEHIHYINIYVSREVKPNNQISSENKSTAASETFSGVDNLKSEITKVLYKLQNTNLCRLNKTYVKQIYQHLNRINILAFGSNNNSKTGKALKIIDCKKKLYKNHVRSLEKCKPTESNEPFLQLQDHTYCFKH